MGEYRLRTLLYRVRMSTPHFSLPRVSIDAQHLSTVRKCRRYHSPLPCVKYRLSTPLYRVQTSTPHFRYRARVSTPHTSLPCSNVDAPLFVTVREYQLPTPLYPVQMSTLHFSLPRVSIDARHHSTVLKCQRSTLRYRA